MGLNINYTLRADETQIKGLRVNTVMVVEVAKHTYQYLFRNGLQGLNPSEAATALNRAVLHLRKNHKITEDQWAPFIHLGI
jgi:hypothetical protein